jgi:hypothetical protein
MNGNFMYLVPIFGMGFLCWVFYLQFREKQIKNQEKIALIEKGLDPSLLDPKPNNPPSSFKIGLLLIGAAIGILFGYIVNLTFGIPNFVAYSIMILIVCGILLVYFHKSKTE